MPRGPPTEATSVSGVRGGSLWMIGLWQKLSQLNWGHVQVASRPLGRDAMEDNLHRGCICGSLLVGLRARCKPVCGLRPGKFSGGNWILVCSSILVSKPSARVLRRVELALPCLITILCPFGGGHLALCLVEQDSYLVDSARSHMLVSKIKPCMSKYKQVYCETANGSVNLQ